MNFRKDVRNDDEFKRDIKAGSIAERQIIDRWLDVVERETGNRPSFKDNGCDNSGEYLEDHQVTQEPDYEVEGYGLIEVKFSKPKLHNVFHLKVDQVANILANKTKLLFANGWATKKEATFSIIMPGDLKAATLNAKQIKWRGFGNKLSYRLRIDQFRWQELP